jgi:hypothetical protein|tara:strand:+ start:440 stop:625 length:186 start_codon:yes stop_codon:yes gene_type:complete
MIRIRRTSRYEDMYHPNMGYLVANVVRIQKTFLGFPFKTLHKYRETYYGEIKDVKDCVLSK